MRADKRAATLVLAAMVLSLGMLTVDVTVVRVALETIQHDLGLSDAAEQWVVNAYLLTLGVFVIAGGRAGDLFGRRAVFLVGLALFTGGSGGCALAPSGGALIAARAVQGIGAAIMTPGVFAIVTDAFAARHLGRAIGILTGTAAAGLSAGPLLGGFLVDAVGWRSIFLINLPLGLVAFVAVAALVPERREPNAPRLDLPGLVLLGVALTALSLGLLQSDDWGWASAATLGTIALGVAALAAFVGVEARVAAPLVDLAVLRRRSVAAADVVGFCAQFVSTAITVLVAIYLQAALGYDPLQTGLLLLPMTVPVLFSAPLAGRLVDRYGARTLVVVGMTLVAVGTAAVGLGGLAQDVVALLPGFVLFGCGFAAVLTTLTTTVMAGAGEHDRGMVSGVFATARNVGASLGVAVTGAVLFALQRTTSYDDAFAVAMFVAAAVAATGAVAAPAIIESRARRAPA